MCWFPSYINMNQPQIYTCPTPLDLPSHLQPHPILLHCNREVDLSTLHHTAFSLSICFHMVMYKFQCYALNSSPPPSPTVFTSLFSISVSTLMVFDLGGWSLRMDKFQDPLA